jgi:hypothetical protein
VLTCLENNRGRWLQSQTTCLSYRRVCVLRASSSELAGVDQRYCRAMSALLLYLCMDRFLQLCSGLDHNHQKVAAGRSVLSLGRGRVLRVSVSELDRVNQSCGGIIIICQEDVDSVVLRWGGIDLEDTNKLFIAPNFAPFCQKSIWDCT